jgi:rhodanese-related sulfurtransferase
MIRDRLKNAAKKAALRAFGMQWQAEELPPNEGNTKLAGGPQAFDPSVIPRVVDGSGDTPGPNHKEKIGRTWVAAQLIGGAGLFMLDIRPAKECAGGIVKGAVVVPGWQIKDRLDVLPARDVRVTVYDQTGGKDSEELAKWLRGQGWGAARWLQGGFAEWLENSEPIDVPVAVGRYALGAPVELKDGGRGHVQGAWTDAGSPRYHVQMDDGSVRGPVGEDGLVA